jgi:hypothetical protein
MHACETRGAVRAGYVVLAGCGVVLALIIISVIRSRKDAKMSSEAALAAISSLHGVAWPSNSVTTAFTLWHYPAQESGTSRNTETLARLEMSDDSFSSWYSYATNFLSEERQDSAPDAARLNAKANWWAPHELGDTNGFVLSHELSQPTGVYSKLRLFIGATGTNHVVYLHCLVRRP